MTARTTLYEAPRRPAQPGETVVTSTCGHNCGGRCVVNAHVARRPHRPHLDRSRAAGSRSCRRSRPARRGVGQIERTYHPDRLQYPMRRAGPRGSGQFERISWDEALDEVAREMLRVRATYGNAAILDASRSGSQSMLHGRAAAQALPLHVRRLHRAVVEHVGRGRGLRRAHDLWRQGRLQDRRARADRLRRIPS